MSGRIVIFDLDGTLTHKDTFIPYLIGFVLRRPWRIFRLWALPVWCALFIIKRIDNGTLKERFIATFLKGASRKEIQDWTIRFVPQAMKRMRAGALEALDRHRRDGDLLVLLSASIDIYVAELGRTLGFEEVICTKVEWRNERITGRLSTPNCHGKEKVGQFNALLARVGKERFNGRKPVIIAYADHQSDLPLLRAVDIPIFVGKNRRTLQVIKKEGFGTRTW